MENTIRSFVRINKLLPADAIIVKKDKFRLVDHYIIYLGDDEILGVPLFIANYHKGVRVLSEMELFKFSLDFTPVRINRFVGCREKRHLAVKRALSRMNENSYNLILNNCEHYARYVQEGVAYSKQVRNVGIGFGILAFGIGIAVVSSSSKEKT